MTSLFSRISGRSRLRNERGAGFIEYALLAAIATVLFTVFGGTITNVAGNVFQKVQCQVASVLGDAPADCSTDSVGGGDEDEDLSDYSAFMPPNAEARCVAVQQIVWPITQGGTISTYGTVWEEDPVPFSFDSNYQGVPVTSSGGLAAVCVQWAN